MGKKNPDFELQRRQHEHEKYMALMKFYTENEDAIYVTGVAGSMGGAWLLNQLNSEAVARAWTIENMIKAGEDPDEFSTMEEVERRYILHVLNAVGGNKSNAARVLGLDRKTLYRKLNSYGVTGDDD